MKAIKTSKSISKKLLLPAIMVSILGLAACANQNIAQNNAETKLENCAIQEVLPGKNMTGAYVQIIHKGKPIQLVKAELPSISPRVELHNMEMKNGVMQMGVLQDLQINEGMREFKKGSDHVMLFDINDKPKIGSTHKMTIYFDNNTKASCDAKVKSVKEVMESAVHNHMHGHKDRHHHNHKH